MAPSTVKRNYYDVLGVAHDADEKVIKRAFRELAQKYHPDHSSEPDAEERFKEIVEAYAVLSDPDKRAEYDAGGATGFDGFSPEDLFAGVDFGDLFGGFGFDTGGGLFERMFHRAGPPAPSRGRDIEVAVSVPLATVLNGGEETVTLSRPGACAICGGSGARPGTRPRPCETCGGSGNQTASSRKGNVVLQQVTTCPTCSGRGTIIEEPCLECQGTGEVIRTDRVKLQIPAGLEEGAVLRVPGYGMSPSDARGSPGDAFVVVKTAPDSRFSRRGADLWRSEEIDVADAVLGTTRRIPTLEGSVSVDIAPATQPGTVLRVAGKGLPHFATGGRGDLFLAIAVRIPERVTDRDRRLWERLRSSSRRDTGDA